jgi:hypothetical protein
MTDFSGFDFKNLKVKIGLKLVEYKASEAFKLFYARGKF